MKKPDLEQFIVSVKAIKFLIFVVFVCYCIIYLQDLHSFYLQHKVYLDKIFNANFVEKNFRNYIDISLDFASLTFIFSLKIIAICVLLYLFNRIPVPKKLLGYWQSDKQIDSLFGKALTQHFRRHSRCHLLDFTILYHNRNVQKYYLNYHSKNEHMTNLFKTFDKEFNEDKI